MFLLMSYFGLGNVYWTFNLLAVFCLFENLKMFYPPEGLCASIVPKMVQLFFTYVLFGLGNVYWTFNLQAVFAFLRTCYLMGRVDGWDGISKGSFKNLHTL